ncbi:hypothetical protein NFHSH190041_17060 [Shewanella sp. NFH-SH190041]|uniref:hypothetical protein n=1 Tax=Shewanella sp. NFH-SH190041 TaxID=2950245 RepID=UPI0021C3E9EB|nr:hypothetical protein [Shewanella sp. NFH-SH190041]BDM64254.1 hypothetical protein NFHSH190041_17060 [Shewanella sp. NFH-SH190041]
MKYEPIDIKRPDCEYLAKFEGLFKFLSKNKVPLAKQNQLISEVVGQCFPISFPGKLESPSESSQYLRSRGHLRIEGYPLLQMIWFDALTAMQIESLSLIGIMMPISNGKYETNYYHNGIKNMRK